MQKAIIELSGLSEVRCHDEMKAELEVCMKHTPTTDAVDSLQIVFHCARTPQNVASTDSHT